MGNIYNDTNVLYSGIFMSSEEMNDLLTKIKPSTDRLPVAIKTPHVVLAKGVAGLMTDMIGQYVKIIVKGYGRTDNCEALLVDLVADDEKLNKELFRLSENRFFTINISVTKDPEITPANQWELLRNAMETEGIYGVCLKDNDLNYGSRVLINNVEDASRTSHKIKDVEKWGGEKEYVVDINV